MSCSMSDELLVGREELKKLQLKCAELEDKILLKDETIRKLNFQLAAAQSFNATHRIRDATLQELIRRRKEALERHRLEYEKRVRNLIDLHDASSGDDEIDWRNKACACLILYYMLIK